MSNPATSLPPGFRFYPTDEELILHYLRNRAASDPCPVAIIAEVDIYKFDPWELPAKAMFGDREWYFFSPRDRKYPNGMRPNRSAGSGYWKATGTDKPIHAAAAGSNEHVGVKKALVFYKGRPPKGLKTDWIMHEYRLAGDRGSNRYKPMKLTDSSMRLDDWVLCRIYKKGSHPPASPTRATDREQEDSGAEEGYLQTNIPQDNYLKMPRPNSISEFLDDFSELSRLFDNLPEMPAPENGSLLGNSVPFSSISSNGTNHFGRQLSRAEPPALIAESYLKRQRGAGNDEEDVILHPSKKRNDPFSTLTRSFASQLDSPQYNLMNHQCLFNPQLLLNSHLGLQ